MAFLPINNNDLIFRGIEQLDFVYISGDAYIDHPSFGVAIITRLIESQGFTIGVIAQPQFHSDYKRLGTPRLAFLVGSGVVDSMVNNYTAALKKRRTDSYSEGGIAGKRPDRALTVYCKNIKSIFPDSAVIIGGIEASLRRFAHYDYWSNEVMHSILYDTKADLLIYGMGEKPFFDVLNCAKKGIPLNNLQNIEGTSYMVEKNKISKKLKENLENYSQNSDFCIIPSFNNVASDKLEYIKAFNYQEKNTDNLNAKMLIQPDGEYYIIQNIPAKRLTEKEMTNVYNLPYERTYHPSYTQGVPAITEVEFSVSSHRGCFGNCSFCALTYHQGRSIVHRSKESIIDEVKLLTENKNFKGYIHDIGGPSANFYNPSCEMQLKNGICKNTQCIGAKKCPNLKVDHTDYLNVLREARSVPKVKKVFIRSGIRFDYILYDQNKEFFKELCKYHISGQLKIAPEHACDNVLLSMNKPNHKLYLDFYEIYKNENIKLNLKQFLVPYFISSHPGSTLNNAITLASYLKSINHMPEQVQDFYPTPSTRSTTMYYTELDTTTLKKIYVAKTYEDKQMQRALLQYRKPENYDIVIKALYKANRQDLIGLNESSLVRPKMFVKRKN